MNELVQLVLAATAGMALGLFYFGGLWLTVRRLPTSRSPALLTLGSFAGRLAVTLLGFYLVTGGRWERLLACLAGFLIARTLLVHRLHPRRHEETPVPQDGVKP
jgi:F1F0 ATPase subunit 2